MKIIFKPWIETRLAQIDKNDPTLSNSGKANQPPMGLPPEWNEQTNSWGFDLGIYLDNKIVRTQLESVSFDMIVNIDDNFNQTITIQNFKGSIPEDLKISMINQAKNFRFKLPTNEKGEIKKESFKQHLNFNDPLVSAPNKLGPAPAEEREFLLPKPNFNLDFKKIVNPGVVGADPQEINFKPSHQFTMGETGKSATVTQPEFEGPKNFKNRPVELAKEPEPPKPEPPKPEPPKPEFRTMYPFIISVDSLSVSTYGAKNPVLIYLTDIKKNVMKLLSNDHRNQSTFFLRENLQNGEYILTAVDPKAYRIKPNQSIRQDFFFEVKDNNYKINQVVPKQPM